MELDYDLDDSVTNVASQMNYTFNCSHFANCTSGPDYEFDESILAWKRISDIVSNIIYIIICLVGLIGNTLVIYVVIRFAKMKTVTNMYIMNLALADEMFLIGIPFLVTTINVKHWIFRQAMCKIYMITASVNQFTSSLFLCVMSSDRYLAVCHPVMSVKYRTPLHAKIVCACVWTISVLVMIPVIMYARTTGPGPTCTVMWPGGQLIEADKAFIWYSFLLGFAIPVTLTLIFYMLVLQRLKTVGPKKKSKEKKRSHRKVTKMVLTVITVYICCWLPYWTIQLVLQFAPAPDAQFVIVIVFLYMLAYANSAMNPILYAFLSDNFKKSFIKAFKCASGSEGLTAETSVFPGRGSRSKLDSRRQQQVAESDEEEDGEMTHFTTASSASAHPLQKCHEVEPNNYVLADMKNGQNHALISSTPPSGTPL